MIVEKLTPEEGYNVKWANLQKHKQQGKKMRKAARRSVWWGNRYLRKRIQKEKEKSGQKSSKLAQCIAKTLDARKQ